MVATKKPHPDRVGLLKCENEETPYRRDRLEALMGLILLSAFPASALTWVAKLQTPDRHFSAGSGAEAQ